MKWCAAALALLALVFTVPTLSLSRAVAEAKACFAGMERRDEAALPDCRREVGFIERLPFIGQAARLDREEMEARQVTLAYLDAAIGAPDRGARAARFEALRPVMTMIEEGSGQLRLDRLGLPLAAPVSGLWAAQLDDRDALRVHSRRFTRQDAQLAALAAALLEGAPDEAAGLAAHYLEAADAEVRLRAAALRCTVGDTAGMVAAVAIESDRAAHLTEGFAQSFGEARVVIEACAERLGRAAPEAAPHGAAGAWDQRARFMAMRLRQLRAGGCGDGESCAASLAANVAHVRQLLEQRVEPGRQLELWALVYEALDADQAEAWLPREVTVPRFADDLLARRAEAPFLVAERWQAAAEALAQRKPGAAAEDAMRAWAAGGYAQRGELERAEAVLAGVAGDSRRAELRVAAALVAGRLSVARAQAADLTDDAGGRLLRAELALPDRQAARALVRAALAGEALDRRVEERARWLAAALGEPQPGAPAMVWVGGSDAQRPERLASLLAAYAQARGAGAGERRAFRHRLYREHRGDAAEGRAAWLFALAGLVEGPGEVAPFLDAMHAVDVRSLTLRQHALSRWLAAAWADAPSAVAWRERLVRLGRLAQDPERRDLLQALAL